MRGSKYFGITVMALAALGMTLMSAESMARVIGPPGMLSPQSLIDGDTTTAATLTLRIDRMPVAENQDVLNIASTTVGLKPAIMPLRLGVSALQSGNTDAALGGGPAPPCISPNACQ